MKPNVKHIDSSGEFYIDEGCYITELSNSADDASVSIAQARVRPGITTRWHKLQGTSERYVILQGEGKLEVGDLPAQQVGPGDVVLIPPDCRQRICNCGRDDLVFLAICSPRFSMDAYQDLED